MLAGDREIYPTFVWNKLVNISHDDSYEVDIVQHGGNITAE